jgi:ATP-dependent Clp protease protease subunit
MIFLLFLSFISTIFSQEIKILKFNTTNNILLKGEINYDSSSKFIYDLNLLPNKNNTYVYLNTPGGSVTDGMKIVSEIKKYNLSCVAETAYSMGFIIFQSCKNRYILPHGKLMQHQMAFGVSDQKSRVESYLDYINQMEREIIQEQTKRINITEEVFKQKIDNDWWLYGENAIKENCADEIVNIECTNSLTKKTGVIEKGAFKYTYSKCPLVSNYIKREKNKNNDNIFTIPIFN